MNLQLNTEKIDIERKRLGLTNEQLANALGMTRQGWYDYLSKPEKKTLASIKKVASFFSLDPKDLLI